MSERQYLISKAQRRETPGSTHNIMGNILAGPPGAAIGSALGAPQGKKGRAAVGGGLGSLGGLVGGAAAATPVLRRVKNPYAKLAANTLPAVGMYTGGSVGHRAAVGTRPYKKKKSRN